MLFARLQHHPRLLEKSTMLTVIVFCISLSTPQLQAQFIPRGYLEIPTSKSENEFTVISAQNKGLFLIKKQTEIRQKKIAWTIIVVDTSLNKKNIDTLTVGYEYDLAGYEAINNNVFLLFSQPEFSAGDFQLFKLNLSDNSITRFSIKHEGVLKLTHFCVIGKSALFGGYIAEKPVVLIYHMTASSNLTAVAGFFKERTKLLDLRVNTNNTFNAVVIEETMFRRKYLITKTFSEWGQLLMSDSTYIDYKVTLTSGMISNLLRNDMMILGTYSLSSNSTTTGLYAAPVNPQVNQRIKYYPFPLFDHFLDYMEPQRAEKVKAKTEKRLKAGKNPIYSAYLHPTKITETKAGFFLFSEMLNNTLSSRRRSIDNPSIYAPPYSPYYMPYYNPYSYPGSYADITSSTNSYTNREQEYIQVVLALFDGSGNLLWDQRLDMRNIEYNGQTQLCDYITEPNGIVIACKKENNLVTNTIKPSAFSLDTLQIPAKNNSVSVLYKYAENTGIKGWYNNYFYTWGYREVQHDKTPQNNSYIFYINKLEAYQK